MKKILLGTTMFAGLLVAGAAQAADLKAPVYKAAQAPVYYNWSGFYIGLNAGYSWGNSDADYVLGGVPVTSFGLKPAGFIGGGQIGYRWQSRAFVFGLAADGAWRKAGDRRTHPLSNRGALTDMRTQPTS